MSSNRVLSWCAVALLSCQASQDVTEVQLSASTVPPQVFSAAADARVESGAPDTVRGDSPYLRAETTGATGAVWSYLKFDVTGLAAPVQSARLRVFVSDGTDDGPKVYGASSSWSESTITWNNRPAPGSVVGDDPLKVPSGGYVEWDVTSLVAGNGPVSFVFVPDSSDRMNGRSKEDVNPPELVIRTAPDRYVIDAEADARVNSEYPTVEYGTADNLWVRPADAANGYPDVRTFLRFTVAGLTAPVTSARVRLYNYDWASNGPRIYRVADNSWSEAAINWTNQPARDATALDDLGPVPSGAYAEWDVSAAVSGNGTYSFVLEGDPTTHSMRAWAREHGALAPQLVVLTGGSASPPPAPTEVRWPISNSALPDADTLGDAYGPRLNSGALDFHAGIDIPAAPDTDVHAVLPGTVTAVDSEWDDDANPCCGGGRRVVIDHGGSPKRYTTYLHLSQTLATPGQTVAAGTVIGKVGISGAQHYHLHFTYSVGAPGEAASRNPLELLPHRAPPSPAVTFGSSDVAIVLPVQQMTVRTIKLEAGSQSRSVDYYAIVALGNPARDGQVQGDGMHLEVPANPTGTPKTFTLRVRPDPASAFVPTKITLDAFDGQRWEFSRPVASSPLSDVITAEQYAALFPGAGIWNYDSFIAAAAGFPAFGTTGDLATRKREVAAFLANVAHETGLLTDLVEDHPAADGYCDEDRSYGCPSTYGYRGRGPLQLTWNYNYYNAGLALGLDLLGSPVQVGTTPSVGWRSSLWFWMTEKGASWESSAPMYPMTGHEAMTSGTTPPGFLATVHVINGGLECGKAEGTVGNEQRNSRVTYYRQFIDAEHLNVSPGQMNYGFCGPTPASP